MMSSFDRFPSVGESKVTFFKELEGLDVSSDEEEDTNEFKSLIRSSHFGLPKFTQMSSQPSINAASNNTTRVAGVAKETQSIQRATSTPGQTSVAETSLPQRKTTLLRYDISAGPSPETSFTSDGPVVKSSPDDKPMTERRTVSTPTIGSVTMTNSLGIANMLKNKPPKEPAKGGKGNKRKAATLEMKPEGERIFNGKVFYYIPDDDVAPIRKIRISKARSYGATWSKDWDSSITHVIVDSDLTFEQIMKWLSAQRNVSEIPSGIVLVNEAYPLDCIRWKRILKPDQPAYKVRGHETTTVSVTSKEPKRSETSLKLKERRSKTREDIPPSPSPVEENPSAISIESAAGNMQPDFPADLVQSPREMSPSTGLKSHGDILDEMIETVKRMPHLDVDDDDQPSPPESGEEMEESGSEGERAQKSMMRRKKRKVTRGSFDQSTFSCMKGGTGKTLDSNPNKRTIELLQELADYYDRVKDTWRTLSYRKAIGTLKRQPEKISTYEEAIALDTIGDRLARKIEEIVQTDRLRKLEHALLDPNDQLLQLFTKVYGAGISQAEKWIQAGYKSLDDLTAHADTLTPNQRIGVDHYVDFNTRIPRDEVTALGKIVQDMASSIDPSVQIIIGGSYRRGAPSSGDIDCLITKPNTTSTNELLRFLHTLISRLTSSSFLVAALAVPGPRDDNASKWHGACVLPPSSSSTSPTAPPIWRRIDFLLVPDSEFGAALIYFTGNDIFNRSLRLLASKKGMRLNQRGLYRDVMRGRGRVKLSEGTLVEGEDERKIFRILGVPWRRPEDRIP